MSDAEFYRDFCLPPTEDDGIAQYWRSGGTTGRPLFYPRSRRDIEVASYTCAMTKVEKVTETRPVRPSTLRVRRYRERRREHLRLLTVEVPEPVIEDAIARGLLKPEESTQAWAVIGSL
jgi:hypothetical protein